jgi:hypothetical protein
MRGLQTPVEITLISERTAGGLAFDADGAQLSNANPQLDPIIRRMRQVLLRPEVPFRGLHRSVPE